jgi:type IV pilus assembly protein PilW
MLTHIDRQRGMTLVELMIASVISLIALAGMLTVYSASSRHSSQQLQRAHLHQQLHTLMQLMASDLKRAGYWHFDPSLQSPAANPFQNPSNELRVHRYPKERAGSCVVFAYDMDHDGLVGVGRCKGSGCPAQSDDDNVEQFGFRLRSGRVQSRYAGNGLNCDKGYWQALTDQDIEITQLGFTQHPDCSNLLEPDRPCQTGKPRLVRHLIEIQLGGQLRNQADSRLQLSRWVHVRNDQLGKGSQSP